MTQCFNRLMIWLIGAGESKSLTLYELKLRVAIFEPNGDLVIFENGSLFVWDGCQACITLPRIDLSGPCDYGILELR